MSSYLNDHLKGRLKEQLHSYLENHEKPIEQGDFESVIEGWDDGSFGETALITAVFDNAGISYMDKMSRIPRSSFSERDDIEEVNPPANITSIGSNAYRFCKNLTEVLLGENVRSIGAFAFANCDNLEKVVISAPSCRAYVGVFRGCPKVKVYLADHSDQPGHVRYICDVERVPYELI